ncbi:RCC1/BLIP-II protein [Hesseltinella vesiculosa]|uniref:RCC1/BLIP-II protein n=1 Tax=Hesseltinella vesiculosa TaxID=101127 RepID=A0A1X2GHX9_9FUNG|nr:RCC1/BLIP-II protein [Hesseltinella vesiculosa]
MCQRVYGTGVGVLNTISFDDRLDAHYLSRFYTNLPLHNFHFVRIAASSNHFLGLSSNGRIYTAGESGYGHLGRPVLPVPGTAQPSLTHPSSSTDKTQRRMTPGRVWWTQHTDITRFHAIACGETFSAALSITNHQLYFWGSFTVNGTAYVGNNRGICLRPKPYPNIQPSLRFRAVEAGNDFLLALTMRGEVVSMGSSQAISLGRASSDPPCPSLPAYVVDNQGEPLHGISIIGTGHHHAFAYSRLQDCLWAWGANDYRQTGIHLAGKITMATPVLRFWPLGTHLVQLSGGRHHSLAVTNTGRVFYFGTAIGYLSGLSRPMVGSLCKGNSWLHPIDIGLTFVSKVACGIDHNLAIIKEVPTTHPANRFVVTWGGNSHFELGQGHRDPAATPFEPVGGRQIHDIAIGGRQSFLLGQVPNVKPTNPSPTDIDNQDFVDLFNTYQEVQPFYTLMDLRMPIETAVLVDSSLPSASDSDDTSYKISDASDVDLSS